jgi:hypothetical protein
VTETFPPLSYGHAYIYAREKKVGNIKPKKKKREQRKKPVYPVNAAS